MVGTLMLFGYIGRDRKETVCQFFPATSEGLSWLREFEDVMPGNYQVAQLDTVDYDKLKADPKSCHALARVLIAMFMP